jgi:hypothetical protein
MRTKVSEVLDTATDNEFRTWSWQWIELQKTDLILSAQPPTLFWSNSLSVVRETAALMMFTAVSSEFIVSTNQTTRRHDPENCNLHTLPP